MNKEDLEFISDALEVGLFHTIRSTSTDGILENEHHHRVIESEKQHILKAMNLINDEIDKDE